MANTVKDNIQTRQIAILIADGVDEGSLNTMKQALEAAGAQAKIIAPHLGLIGTANGKKVKADQSFLTAASVLFDAVYIPDGSKGAAALQEEPDAIHFVNEAYKHCKAIAADGAGARFLQATAIRVKTQDKSEVDKNNIATGVLVNRSPKEFMDAIAQHRFWEREKLRKVPA